MRTSSRDPDTYEPWMIGVALLLALLSAARLHDGWHWSLEDWLALAVLIGSLAGAARLLSHL